MKKSVVLPLQDEHGLCPFEPGSLDEDLKTISECGYDGVELGITDPDTVSVNAVKEKLKHEALELSALTTGQAYGIEGISITERDPGKREMAKVRIKSHIDFASNFEATPVIIGSLRGVGDSPQATRWLVENLSEVAEYAETMDVEIAFEPLNRYESQIVNSVETALEIVEEVGSPKVGLLFDTFHANIEEPNISESIRKGAEQIIYVHLADSNRWAPGYGHLDFPAVFSVLKEVGYEGFCSLESLPKPNKKECLNAPFEI